MFWSKFEGKVGKVIDEKIKGVEERLRKGNDGGTGSSRTGGRSTITSLLADFMFGKPASK